MKTEQHTTIHLTIEELKAILLAHLQARMRPAIGIASVGISRDDSHWLAVDIVAEQAGQSSMEVPNLNKTNHPL